MKKGLQRGLSLLVVMMMITSMFPFNVMAEETGVKNEGVVKQESITGNIIIPPNNAQDKNVSENNQPVTTEDPGVINEITSVDGQITNPLKPEVPQNSVTTDGIQTSATEGDYEYTDIDGGISVTGYHGSDGDLVVPSTLGGKQVLGIGDYAFSNCSNLTSISLPAGLTGIGDYAFQDCSNLMSISLPEGITSIAMGAFQSCYNLTSINLPAGLTSIGDYAFNGCYNLTNINLPEGLTSIGSYAFAGCGLTSISLPAGLTGIGDYAFNGCSNLTGISLPEGITSIAVGAFQNCSNLTSISLPKSVTSIGNSVFAYCGQLSRVDIPASIIMIGSSVFQGSSLVTIYGVTGSVAETYAKANNIEFIDGSSVYVMSFTTDKTSTQKINTMIQLTAEGTNGKTPYQYKFYYKLGTETVTIQDYSAMATATFKPTTAGTYTLCVDVKDADEKVATRNIDDYLITETDFDTTDIDGGVSISGYHGSDGDLVVPLTIGGKQVLGIGDYAFSNCSNLTSISLPAGLTGIGDYAFQNCSNLTSISLPEGITSIGVGAFQSCSNLTSISLPAGLTSIGVGAFQSCYNLISISLPESLDSIPWGAFNGCGSLTSINLPAGLTSIGDNAFNGCYNLTGISLPESLDSIPWGAFNGCSSLTSINLPAGLTSIGFAAFNGCSNLTSINLPEGLISIGDFAFWGCGSLTSISLPKNVTSIGDSAFAWCYQLSRIDIPASVTTIGNGVFDQSSLVTIYGVTGSAAETYAKANNIEFIDGSSVYVMSFTTDKASVQSVNTAIQLTAEGTNGKTPYQYKFYYKLGTETVTIQDYSAMATATFKPTTAGTYTLCVDVKDADEKVATKNIDDYLITETDFDTTDIDGGVSITGYRGSSGDLVVPSTIGGKQVLGIGDYAFSNCSNLTSISLPAGLTSIGVGAFQSCWQLTSIKLPDGLTSIGDSAFNNCYNLTGISLPEGITSIGVGAFQSCSNLTSISLPAGLTSIGDCAFNGCSNLTGIGLPEELTSIGVGAFQSCSNLTSISLPAGLTSIGDYAFNGCSNLTGISLLEGLTSIGVCTFQSCYNLTSISLPKSVTSIGDSAFAWCSQLSRVDIPASVIMIGSSVFQGSSLVTIYGVTGSVAETYAKANNIEFIDGSSVYVISFTTDKTSAQTMNTTIQLTAEGTNGKTPYQYKFYYKLGTETVTIRDYSAMDTATFKPTTTGTYTLCVDVKDADGKIATRNIDDYLITETDFETTNIDGGVSISRYHGSDGDLVVPSTLGGKQVLGIGDYAFSNCSNLTSISLPEGIISIGVGAFQNCWQLTSINLPAGLTNIGDYAFSSCNNLTSISLPEGLTSIGDSAFWGCGSLTSISLPKSVTSIGNSVFAYCGQLSRVDIPISVTTIGSSVFQESSLVTIYGVTGSVAETYAKANNISFVDSSSLYVKRFTSDKASPQSMNTTIQLTAEGTNGKTPYQYKFYYKLGTETVTIQEYSTMATAIFKPTTIGIYTLCVDVRDTDGKVTTRNIYDYLITETDFEYTPTDGGIIITGYHGSGGNLVVPSTLGGKKVLGLGDYAFSNCSNLTSISLPEGITSIGVGAFQSCYNLMSISLPESLDSIPWGAFQGCGSLTSISLSEGLTSIGNYAFSGCYNLMEISLPKGITTIGDNAFSYCQHLIRIDIPASVTTIGKTVFDGSNLVTIYGVTGSAIETYAKANSITFVDSSSVYAMSFTTDKESAQTINAAIQLTAEGTNGKTPYQYKFYYKLGTETVIIQDYSATATATFKPTTAGTYTLCVDIKDADGKVGTKYIRDYMVTETDFETIAIDGGISITGYHGSGGDLVIPPTLGGKQVLKIENYAFQSCSSVTSISLPEGLNSIGDFAFAYCDNLTSINIPKSVTSIGANPFRDCISLNNLAIDAGNSSYKLADGLLLNQAGTKVIAGLSDLATVTIPEGVISIGDYAFGWCQNLESISIPKSVTSIRNTAFAGSWNLTSITVAIDNENYKSVEGVLYNKAGTILIACPYGTTAPNIPASVTTIGDSAFMYCRLSSIKLPEGVTSIGINAFFNSSLTNISIPKGVISIGDYTFAYSSQLARVDIPESVTTIGPNVFKESDLVTIYGVVGSFAETYAKAHNIAFVDEATFLLGDVDGNGSVSAFDALVALQIATGKKAGTPEEIKAADVGGSGEVEAFDALRILQYATGKITEF